MNMKNKWIAVLLAIGMICAAFVGCDQQAGTDNPQGSPDSTTSANGSQNDAPATKYGNFTTEGTPRTLEEIFKKELQHTEDTFATGSSYSDDKIANIYKIADYIANYEKYIEEYDAQEEFDELYEKTGFTMDFGFGSEMIKHYVGMSGETYDYTDEMPSLLAFPKVSAAQTTCINAAMKAAENLVKDGQTVSAINQSTPASFSSLKSTDGPIYFALGSYHVMVDMSNVKRTGDSLTATVTFRIVDYYDWSENGTEPEFTSYLDKLDEGYRTLLGEMVDMPTLETFCQADMAQLHYAGFAQNFLAHGTIVYNVSWTAGQTFDQATVQVVE